MKKGGFIPQQAIMLCMETPARINSTVFTHWK